ncbi:sigma-70 family RNA polymerase sigma factor [Brevibacillus ginsengisoli]|uniref:sigma-70 family RNA polymerase sigma factor n=1 Tax=Brevibacillus ginsengisoli TaxID=363854 RepID=UPI003CF00311
MTDMELYTWIKRVMNKDQAAFEILYEYTRDDIFRTVTFLMNNQSDVQDIVNEVYIQLWRSLPNYDPRRPFHLWLHGLVIRQVSNWRRKVWRMFRLLERSRLEERETELPATEHRIVMKETNQELLQAIARLSYKLRVVIVYRYFHDYTLEQIAALLNIPVGTVKSRHHLALKEMRKQYTTQGIGKVEAQDVY